MALCSRSDKRPPLNRMRTYVILQIILISTLICQSIDTTLTETFPLTNKLLHHPPSPFFKGRPYFLELIVDFPWDSLENASIFFKTEKSIEYQEIPLEKYRKRLRFKYDPELFPGDTLSYFFIVTRKDFSIFAIPLDGSGKIKTVNIHPIEPTKYYEQLPP